MGGSASKVYLDMREMQQERRQKQGEKLANSRRGQRMMKSRRMKRYIEKRDRELTKGVEIRKAEEADRSKGEPVWFSRYVLDGRLKHWALVTHNTKYELRSRAHIVRARTANGDIEKGADKAAVTTKEDEALREPHTRPDEEQPFTYSITPYTIDQEKLDALRAESLVPALDGYYVCLIGWTRLTKEQVDALCKTTMDTFGKYKLLRNNCQHFLKHMAADGLIASKAADFGWFMDNTKTKYQRDQLLKPPPAELLLHLSQNMTAQQNATVRNNQLQNQLQMQLQTQLQNQLQIQLQTQLQAQVNAAGGAGGAAGAGA